MISLKEAIEELDNMSCLDCKYYNMNFGRCSAGLYCDEARDVAIEVMKEKLQEENFNG